MARIDEEPDVIKFIRSDSVQYEHEWDPDDYSPQHARQVLLDHIDDVVEAERLGWDGYFLTEHHFDGWTLAPQPNILLTAVAMRTSRIRLGHSVQVLPVHNPIFLAEQYGMLDVLSGGRLEVGLGRGNFDFEWDRYSEDREDAVRLFDEKFDLLTKALTQSRFTHDGPIRVAQPSTIYPRPMQRPLPMWTAAVNSGSIERAAERGLGVFSAPIPDGGERVQLYVDAAKKHGHTVSAANFAVSAKIICAPTDREAELINERNNRLMLEVLDSRGLPGKSTQGAMQVAGFTQGIVGSPETVRDQLTEIFTSTGARRLIALIRFRGIPGEAARQTQRLLATDVFPHLRHLPAMV